MKKLLIIFSVFLLSSCTITFNPTTPKIAKAHFTMSHEENVTSFYLEQSFNNKDWIDVTTFFPKGNGYEYILTLPTSGWYRIKIISNFGTYYSSAQYAKF